MAATQIKLWEVSVFVCVCVYMYKGWRLLPCVFPAVASAGATGELDSVRVIELLYKVTSTTSDRFNLRGRL